jgi:hypothetical protein
MMYSTENNVIYYGDHSAQRDKDGLTVVYTGPENQRVEALTVQGDGSLTFNLVDVYGKNPQAMTHAGAGV